MLWKFQACKQKECAALCAPFRAFFLAPLLAALLLFFAASTAWAGGQAYHVDKSRGDDSNSGAKSSPFRTIEKALQAAAPGDEVLVYPGQYPYKGPIKIYGIKGTAKNPIVIKPADGRVKIDGKGKPYAIEIRGCSHLSFQGFEIFNADYGILVGANRGAQMGVIEDSHPIAENVTVSNNLIHNVDKGIRVLWEQYWLGGDEKVASDFETSRIADISITGNEIYDVVDGIYLENCFDHCRGALVERNLICRYRIFGIQVGFYQDFDVRNNTVVNGESGINLRPFENLEGLIMKGAATNNILAYNRSYGLVISENFVDVDPFDYNLYWQNKGGDLYTGPGKEPEAYPNGGNMVYADPLFKDLEHGDYRLSNASPCIDAGSKEPDGYSGSAWDIGYWEMEFEWDE